MRAHALAGWTVRRKGDGDALFRDPMQHVSDCQGRRASSALPPHSLREDLNARLLATRFGNAWLRHANAKALMTRAEADPHVDFPDLKWELRVAIREHEPRSAKPR